MTTNIEQTNLIERETIMNTRKELWGALFLFVDFSRIKNEYPNMWNKNYQLLPLPKVYQETKEKFTKYCQGLSNQIENLITSFEPWFRSNVYPILESESGDKTLLFRCDRLFNNKMIGETSSLFLDLLIFETDYLAKEEAKQGLNKLVNQSLFLDEKLQEQIQSDIEKLLKRMSYQVINTFYRKWINLVSEQGTDLAKQTWEELPFLLREWEKGKIGSSKWKGKFKEFTDKRDELFNLGSNNISGQPFFQLGGIKKDGKDLGLIIATQNRKAFNLNNPFIFIINFHQKYYRVYTIEKHNYVNPRNLYVTLNLKEDWVWRDYPWIMNSLGSLKTANHPFYHSRNLPE